MIRDLRKKLENATVQYEIDKVTHYKNSQNHYSANIEILN